MSKPTNKPGWNPTDSSKVVEPTSTKKAQGWAAGEKPAAEHFNWLMKTVSEWIDHIDAEGVKGPKGDTGPQGPAGASGSISSADLARIAALEAVSGVVAASPVTVTFPYLGGAAPSEYTIGDSGSSVSVNWGNGASQFVTLTADATISFSGATAGNTYYLRIQQGGYGLKRVIGWPTNIIWNSGSVPTISTAAWTVDVIGCYYDGTNYYGYVSQGYFTAPSGIDTKNGYIAGGWSAGSSGVFVPQLEKMNLNSDTTFSIVQTQLGYIKNSSGTDVYPINRIGGQGTQSSTHGYRTYDSYSSLPTVNGQTDSATSKVPFSNDTQLLTVRLISSGNGNVGTGGFASGRGGIVQNSTKAYKTSYATSVSNRTESLTFSTDTIQYISTLNNLLRATNQGNAGLYNWFSFATSKPSEGTIWQAEQLFSGFHALTAIKFLFSNETNLYASNFSSLSVNQGGGYGEAIDGNYNGYIQKTTSTAGSGISQLEKVDKSTDTWNIVTTNNNAVTTAAAFQGNTAGYLCGGTNSTAVSPGYVNSGYPTSASVNTVKKVLFAPETFSTHSASLNTSRLFAAGFEG